MTAPVSAEGLALQQVLAGRYSIERESRNRCLREARASARPSHLNIVPIHNLRALGADPAILRCETLTKVPELSVE